MDNQIEGHSLLHDEAPQQNLEHGAPRAANPYNQPDLAELDQEPVPSASLCKKLTSMIMYKKNEGNKLSSVMAWESFCSY